MLAADLAEYRALGIPVPEIENPHVTNSKLTPDDVRRIRELWRGGFRQAPLAVFFGVTKSTISNVVSRKTWKGID